MKLELPTNYNDWLKLCFIICLFVSAGWFTMNQILDFRYKERLLTDPCSQCVIDNPELKECIYPNQEVYNIPEIPSMPMIEISS